MGKKVLIVKNITREGPGLLEEALQQRGVAYDLVDLDRGDSFPSPEGHAAVFVLGGPDSANDRTPKMENELARIRQALDLGIPYLGICLGLQTLVKAAGGQVVKNPVREIGFRDSEGERFTVELTEEGRADPFFEGLGDTFEVFHLHGETVVPTDVMRLLGTGAFCRNQIVKVGRNAYGIQCHFELTPAMFGVWLAEDPDLRAMDQPSLRQDFEKAGDEYARVGRRLFENFLKIAGW